MAASTDFNYADILSLEKAKLVKRSRLNFLGSKELVLDYHNIGSASKEECVEWLDDNRLTLTNPTFSYKTYTGVWKCIDITYDEDTKILRQRFKIDSSLGTFTKNEAGDDLAGSGDVVQQSSGSLVERSYYWRVVDPSTIAIPDSPVAGNIFTKSAVDNGDGTYDVTITKETASNLTATSAVSSFLYAEETEVNTSYVEQSFVGAGYGSESVAVAGTGEIKRIDNVALENGKFRTSITTRTSVPFRYPSTEGTSFTWFSDWDVSQPNYYILGRNRTLAQFATDQGLLPNTCVRTHSLTINDDGTCNYTINGYV